MSERKVLGIAEVETTLDKLATAKGKSQLSDDKVNLEIGQVMLSFYAHYKVREAHEKAVERMKTSWKDANAADLAKYARIAFLSDLCGKPLHTITGQRNYRKLFPLIKVVDNGFSFKKTAHEEKLRKVIAGKGITHNFKDEGKRDVTLLDVLTSDTVFDAIFGTKKTSIKVNWGITQLQGKSADKVEGALTKWVLDLIEKNAEVALALRKVCDKHVIDVVEPEESVEKKEDALAKK